MDGSVPRSEESVEHQESTGDQEDEGELVRLTTRADQPNTIKHHLHYTSARIAVDKSLSTDHDNGHFLQLRPISNSSAESQHS